MLVFYSLMVDTPEEKALVEKLYDTYEQMMYKIALNILRHKYDAEDAIHEAFFSIIRSECLHKLSDVNSLYTKSYIIVAVKNAAYKIYNSRKKNAAADINEFYDLQSNDTTEETVVSSFGVQEIKEAMRKLSEGDYDILCLSLINQLSNDEIAAMLGINTDAVRQRIHRAKKRLSKILKERSVV